MAENENDIGQNLDLAQILETLANLPKTADAPPQVQEQQYNPSTQFALPSVGLTAPHHPVQSNATHKHGQHSDPRLHQPAPQHRQQAPVQGRISTPTIDPTTIIEWKHGLRCVNKLAAQNPSFVPSIQKLMKDQERNIKDWEAGRQRLIEDQTIKRENEKTHRAALSLPGLLENTAPLRTPEREAEELAQYDQKVYRACRRMFELQSAQLKSLGVPFFGVRLDLLLPDDSMSEDMRNGNEETRKGITKKELLELQRKILNHLMELYGD